MSEENKLVLIPSIRYKSQNNATVKQYTVVNYSLNPFYQV